MSGGLAVVFLVAVFGAPMLVIAFAARAQERRWPTPREHHDFLCPQCPCSYESASALARHWTAMHTNQTAYRLPVDGGPRRAA